MEFDENRVIEDTREIRRIIVKCGYESGRGHVSSALSCADILGVLYCSGYIDLKKIRNQDDNRDRIILSKAHAGLAQYAAMVQCGLMNIGRLNGFCAIEGELATHPERDIAKGIEHTGGSLGQGITFACGVAKALLLSNSHAKVYVVVGDAEMQEGIVWESLLFASHHKLNNLTIIVDDNEMQISGRTNEILNVSSITKKLDAFGIDSMEIDGHDERRLVDVIFNKESETVRAIVCKTKKGKGVSFIEDKPGWHGRGLDNAQYEAAVKELDEW